QQKYEKTLEKSILDLLKPVLGNKITTKVNVDLDFDSKQETKTEIDPNKVIVSQQTLKEMNSANGEELTEGPVDNNMGNTIEDEEGNINALKEEEKTNYESGKTETKTISAPGEVRRLTATVFVDGNLEPRLQEAVEKAVGTAIGFKAERGDDITVEGILFDPLAKDENGEGQDVIDEMLKTEKRNKMILFGIIGIIVLGIIVTTIVILIKRRNRNEDDEDEEGNLLDVVIDDRITKNIVEPMAPIDFGGNDQKTHREDEIKKYAQDKPEQVAEIIKSWLSENER
ncbi:MAG: flagellar M-ring protein FliF C-terminal domain-containing protein, partial [Clostridium sp.]